MRLFKRVRLEAAFLLAICCAAAALYVSSFDAAARPYEGPDTAPTFVNWESPHVHPLDITPDGQKLLACNTADNRLEVFDISTGTPRPIGSVFVGLDPCSVRARTNTEAWVVNHVSDTVSIVNLNTLNVVRTLNTDDEPADVVFASPGGIEKAFVSCSQANSILVFLTSNTAIAPTRITIDAEDPRALAVSPDGTKVFAAIFESGNNTTIINGNHRLEPLIPRGVHSVHSPYFNPNQPFQHFINPPNPPPNNGTTFSPPIHPSNAPPIGVSLIVKRDDQGRWMDDNNHDWTAIVSGAHAAESGRPVGWNLPDRDVAIIDTSSLTVTWATGLMNICMGIAVNPASGVVSIVGTDALNHIRYEPNLKGIFTRVEIGQFRPGNPQVSCSVRDMNSHLTYATRTLPTQAAREVAIGDPRGIIWLANGSLGFVSGMGSNNVIVINQTGARAAGISPGPGQPAPLVQPPIPVGEGPTGMALDENRGTLYVLNRFAGSISSVNIAQRRQVLVTPFFDPTPAAIKVGRKHLYDTHKNSGLGQASCASCHVDARFDRLAWDLGNPAQPVSAGAVLEQNLGAGIAFLRPVIGVGDVFGQPAPYLDWNEMKGPMTTQTLQDIIGHEPHHWRGDRDGIEAFADAFMGLLGDDTTLTAAEMQEFEDYLATIHYPPNPFRNMDNSLPTSLDLTGHFSNGRFADGLALGAPLPPGNAANGQNLYVNRHNICAGAFSCATCHTLPTGMGTDWHIANPSPNHPFPEPFTPFPIGPLGEHHRSLVSIDGQTNASMKTPNLRNMHEKTGCNFTQVENRAGFGYMHDGTIDSIERFMGLNAFNIQSDQEVADLTAFMLCFSGSDLMEGSPTDPFHPPGGVSKDSHAAVGKQVTLDHVFSSGSGQAAMLGSMRAIADTGKVGMIAKGIYNGHIRGFMYLGDGRFQSDHIGEIVPLSDLTGSAGPGREITFTIVPINTQRRMGIDRDLDGILDFDEGTPRCVADVDDGSGSGVPDGGVTIEDLLYYLSIFDMGLDASDVDDGSMTGTPDGGVTIEDLLYFLFRFDSGC